VLSENLWSPVTMNGRGPLAGGAERSGGFSERTSGSVRISSGELALRDRFGKVLPLSIVVRFER
ncbi:MAG: hypothetical protein J5695_01265, partial [Bacteroidales bacterium]|nr:hypothetical protein [Bacteroidales bacterium]